jgi:hypothetical protein
MLFVQATALEFPTGSAGTVAVSGNFVFYYLAFPTEVVP